MVWAMSTSPTSCSFLLVEGLLWSRHRLSFPLISRNFKIDTGADVTVISDNDFKGIKGQTLIKSDKKLSGPGKI
jgi:hypothetical protein